MVFLTLIEKYPGVRDETELIKLTMRIAGFKIKEVLRVRQGDPLEREDGSEIPVPDNRPTPFDQALLLEVKAAIAKLGEDCRKILKLELEGYSYDDMASMLSRSKETLYVQSLRCHRRLKGLVNENRKGGRS